MQKSMDKVKIRNNALDTVKERNEVKKTENNCPRPNVKEDNFTGTELVATNATIPSKYQTVVIVESDKKGFLTTAKRFKNITNDIPGPGKYVSHSDFETNSTSYSTKGTGGLASMSKRKFSLSSTQNGGSFVMLPSSFNTKSDFNRSGNTRPFQKKIAEQLEPIPLPAPNQYQINSKPRNKMSAESAFRSQTKREFSNFQAASEIPGPCQYSINYDLVHASPKGVSCTFKSKSRRIHAAEELSVPGPGAYNPNTNGSAKSKPKDLRKHYLCLSAPPHQITPQPGFPGPGTYDIATEFTKKSKRYISSPAFVSTTKRMGLDLSDASIPGPGSYYLFKPPKKQSFYLNVGTKWI